MSTLARPVLSGNRLTVRFTSVYFKLNFCVQTCKWICLYMKWDTSYVSFKYTKGREETAEQVWFVCLFFCSLPGEARGWMMLSRTSVLQLLGSASKCIVLDPWETARVKWSNLWPWWFFYLAASELCPPLGILEPFCHTGSCLVSFLFSKLVAPKHNPGFRMSCDRERILNWI